MIRSILPLLLASTLLAAEPAKPPAAPAKKADAGSVSKGTKRKLEDIDGFYAQVPPVKFTAPADRFAHLPRTAGILQRGGTLKIVMLGDSIIADTARSSWPLLVERMHPKVKAELTTSVRGSTGCWWYKDENRVQKFVLDHEPDLLIIGGISQRDDVDAIREVIGQVRAAGSKADVFLMTGPFGSVDPQDPKAWAANLPRFHSYRDKLAALAKETGAQFLDLRGAWASYIQSSGQPTVFFMRDKVHANDKGEQILGRVLEAYFKP